MIILTGEDREKMEYYAKRFRDVINDAIEHDGDLWNRIFVYQIYDETRELVRNVLGNEEANKMEKHRESARVNGMEKRMSELEKRNRTLEDDLRQNRAELQNFKRSLAKEEAE